MAASEAWKEIQRLNEGKKPVESGAYGFEPTRATWDSHVFKDASGKPIKKWMARIVMRAAFCDDGTRIEDAFENVKREDGYEVPLYLLAGTPEFALVFGGVTEDGPIEGMLKWNGKPTKGGGGEISGEMWAELEYRPEKPKQKGDGTPILDKWQQPVCWPAQNAIVNMNGPLMGLGKKSDVMGANLNDNDMAEITALMSAPVAGLLDPQTAMADAGPPAMPGAGTGNEPAPTGEKSPPRRKRKS